MSGVKLVAAFNKTAMLRNIESGIYYHFLSSKPLSSSIPEMITVKERVTLEDGTHEFIKKQIPNPKYADSQKIKTKLEFDSRGRLEVFNASHLYYGRKPGRVVNTVATFTSSALAVYAISGASYPFIGYSYFFGLNISTLSLLSAFSYSWYEIIGQYLSKKGSISEIYLLQSKDSPQIAKDMLICTPLGE